MLTITACSIESVSTDELRLWTLKYLLIKFLCKLHGGGHFALVGNVDLFLMLLAFTLALSYLLQHR